MSWRDLLGEPDAMALPWFGRGVRGGSRYWRVRGRRPPDHGWYRFQPAGRFCTLVGPAEPDLLYADAFPTVRGYCVGNRLIPDDAWVRGPDQFADHPAKYVGYVI